MARGMLRGMLGGVLMSVVALTAHAQGISFEILHGNDRKAVDKGTYMPGMFRQEGEDGEVSILRLDKELMITLIPSKKSYREMTFAEMGTRVKKGRSMATDAMKKRMQGMPPEQRKKLEERMAALTGTGEDVKTDIVQTGGQKTIEGYRCTGYVVKRNGKDVETIWASKDVPNFASVRHDFQRIVALFSSIGSGRNAFASIEKIDGFPIETIGTGYTEKITKIRSGSFPVSAFEVPPGYTKATSEDSD